MSVPMTFIEDKLKIENYVLYGNAPDAPGTMQGMRALVFPAPPFEIA